MPVPRTTEAARCILLAIDRRGGRVVGQLERVAVGGVRGLELAREAGEVAEHDEAVAPHAFGRV